MVCWVVIAALQIIEAGFYVIIVATVTKRIKIGKGRAGSLLIDDAGSGRIGNPNQFAPCVVGVGGVGLLCVTGDVAVGILNCNRSENLHHITLLVQCIEIVGEFCAVVLGILDCKGSALGIVGEDHDLGRAAAAQLLVDYLAIQDAVLMLRIPYLFIGANAVGIVCIGGRLASGGNGGQLPPVFPGQAGVGRSVIPVLGIADLVIGNRMAVH